MTTYSVIVQHNFETAHRLPELGGKCFNLHGHSWWVEVTVAADELQAGGTVVEFGEFKRALRGWLDDQLDHGTMLGAGDPLLALLAHEHCKVFVFGSPPQTSDTIADSTDLTWPTVENVAVLLGRVATSLLSEVSRPAGARISLVRVHETRVNAAEWKP